MKAVVVDVGVALADMAVAKRALKVALVAHAMVPLLHAVVDLHRVHALIAKIAAKEDLIARHQTVSMSAAIDATTVPMMDPTTATWTETMTVAPVATSCRVTSTLS